MDGQDGPQSFGPDTELSKNGIFVFHYVGHDCIFTLYLSLTILGQENINLQSVITEQAPFDYYKHERCSPLDLEL